MPSIWAFIGFFVFAVVGAYFYYRELSEIRGHQREEDLQSFRDDELLESLQPIATVAFRRSIPLASGSDLALGHAPDGTLQIERISIPVAATRKMKWDLRRAFHGHQLLALAEALAGVKLAEMAQFAWPDPAEIEGRVLKEWPGYQERLQAVRGAATEEIPLYPQLNLRYLPVAAEVESPVPESTNKSDPSHSQQDARLVEQRRVERTEADRGLHIERVEKEQEMTRGWEGEKRDEMAGEPGEEPDAPIDIVRTSTPVFHVVRVQSKPQEYHNDGEGIRYDEWDMAEGRYRRRYCRVTTRTPASTGNGRTNRVLQELAPKRQVVREVIRLFDSLRPIPQRRGRQPDGDAIDIDAFVDQTVQLKQGGSMSENLYEQHLRMERSVAVTLLMDISASTERWTGHRRAFEVGIETVALFGMGQRVLGDEVEILGFSGSGPENVCITNFKLFDEPWSDTVFSRLDQIEPQLFTRMGTAIRHASASLSRRRAQHKLLLILSDAQPQDEDGYEGQYGLADTRRALDEARRIGVKPYCLTLDAQVAPQLRLLFRQHYAIHLDPETLPLKLPKVFAALTRHE